jgi:methyl-accepting chemotaxis protein
MKNVPIIGKFLVIIAIFGVFAIGVAFYATSQMQKINTDYTSLLGQEEAASIDLSRASRHLQTMRASIDELVIATNQQGIDRGAASLAEARKNFEEFMGATSKALASDTTDKVSLADANDIDALHARGISVVEKDCADAIKYGSLPSTPQNVKLAEAALLGTCSPAFEALTPVFKTETDKMVSRSDTNAQELAKLTKNTVVMTFGVILGGLAMVIGIAFFAIRSWITTPLRNLNGTMETLAKGDLTALVSGEDRKDEVGSMARTVQVFKDAGLDKVRIEAEAVEHRKEAEAERARNEAAREVAAKEQAQVVDSLAMGLEKLSDGDLVFRLRDSFAADYEKLRNDFNGAMDKLQETMKLIAANTSSIRGSTEEITQAADDLSKRTEQQAASLEETAAALDQITATVRRTAEGATEARDVVSTAKADAEHSGAVVRQAVEAMSGIEKSSQQISQIIGVIDEIAFQTNLLALNAGVEAARAGDAGRGFAVVASEVRALAQRSAEAAKEIKTLISASTQQVDAGVNLVGETGKALERIVIQVTQINTVVTDIAASAQEQASGLHQVNTAVNQMDQVTQQNAAMVEESTAASHSLAQETEDLAKLIAQFQVGQSGGDNVRRGPGRRPASASNQTRPALKTVGRGGAAYAPQHSQAEESWEEF